MNFRFDWSTAGAVAGVIAIGWGLLGLGQRIGANSVIDSAILAAENEVLYRIVTVQSDAPSTELMDAAKVVCEGQTSGLYDNCMMDFLGSYGDVWVVNLVDGDRTLLIPGTLE